MCIYEKFMKILRLLERNIYGSKIYNYNERSLEINNVTNSFPLEEVPELVLLCIAKHLPTDAARNLSHTCRKFKNILPTYPNPLIIKGPNVDERQHHSDWHFTPKKYFQSPILESSVERIDMKMKWKDQVCTM